MAMKLNKIEKIIVAVIILGIILVGGAFMFIVPTFDKMDKANKARDANLLEKQNLEAELSRLNTIDSEITESKTEAIKHEGDFYPDLTTYETSEIAMALMKKCNLEAHEINVTTLSTYDLTLEYSDTPEIEYDLKTFAKAAKNAGETSDETAAAGEGGEIATTGEFTDGGKTYTVNIGSVSGAQILDDTGEVVEPSRYSEKMKKVLKGAVCRFVQDNHTNITVACTKATYEVTGKFSDYMKFVDYVYGLQRASMFTSVDIPMTMAIPKEDEDEEDENGPTYYVREDGTVVSGEEAGGGQMVVEDNSEVTKSLTITFLSVEPMDPLKTVDAGGTKVVVDQRPAVY